MEQRLELLLVHNLLSLEMARFVVEGKLEKYAPRREQPQGQAKTRSLLIHALRKSALLNLAIAAVALLAAIGINALGSRIPERGFWRFLVEQFLPILLCLVGVVFLVFGAYRYWISVQQRQNAQALQRQRRKEALRRQQQEQRRQQRLAYYQGEQKELERLMTLCYLQCHVPGNYRNALSLLHIHDYMIRQDTDLENAVMHEQYRDSREDPRELSVEQARLSVMARRLELDGDADTQTYLYQSGGAVADSYRQCGSYFRKAPYLNK